MLGMENKKKKSLRDRRGRAMRQLERRPQQQLSQKNKKKII
jgi:hypothetical protein